jgi:hypothetical protein
VYVNYTVFYCSLLPNGNCDSRGKQQHNECFEYKINAVVDVCPNIDGNQTSIPSGMIKDANGNCVTTPPVDVCPNIDGNQTSIPSGMIKDANGNCVEPTTYK